VCVAETVTDEMTARKIALRVDTANIPLEEADYFV
jgi:hypothetical protein